MCLAIYGRTNRTSRDPMRWVSASRLCGSLLPTNLTQKHGSRPIQKAAISRSKGDLDLVRIVCIRIIGEPNPDRVFLRPHRGQIASFSSDYSGGRKVNAGGEEGIIALIFQNRSFL